MNFNKHSEKLLGSHAILSPSSCSWLNYEPDKLKEVFKSRQAIERGTRLHAVAKELIELQIRLPKKKITFNMYVNDAIGYRMTPEQILVYSGYCFGTADAIAFDEKKGFLRIHDLKTGSTPAKMDQLRIYAALFCLEYRIRPGDIDFELNIYQSNEIKNDKPRTDEILPIMDKIILFDQILEDMQDFGGLL